MRQWHCRRGKFILPPAGNDVNRVNNPGNIPQKRQQDIQPKVQTDTHLKKHSQRGKKYRKNKTDDIHNKNPFPLAVDVNQHHAVNSVNKKQRLQVIS